MLCSWVIWWRVAQRPQASINMRPHWPRTCRRPSQLIVAHVEVQREVDGVHRAGVNGWPANWPSAVIVRSNWIYGARHKAPEATVGQCAIKLVFSIKQQQRHIVWGVSSLRGSNVALVSILQPWKSSRLGQNSNFYRKFVLNTPLIDNKKILKISTT